MIPAVRPVLLGLRVPPELRDLLVPPVPPGLPVRLDQLARQAPTAARAPPGLWVQSFMRNFSDSLTADNVELVFVVFNKLYNSAVLVCELEFNINASVFVNINCVDQLDEQTARE